MNTSYQGTEEALVVRSVFGHLNRFTATSKGMDVADTIICPDYQERPEYPSWVHRLVNQDLEAIGPRSYHLRSVCLWRSFEQDGGGCIVGRELYDTLTRGTFLRHCLSLRDGLSIARKGADIFHEHFPNGDEVFLWKSLAEDVNGNAYAPYLVERLGTVKIRWRSLDSFWSRHHPAAHIRR